MYFFSKKIGQSFEMLREVCQLLRIFGPGAVAQAYNPSFLGGRNQRIMELGQQDQKVLGTPSQQIKAGHGGMPLSPQLCREA
jgi:hypothetical protein